MNPVPTVFIRCFPSLHCRVLCVTHTVWLTWCELCCYPAHTLGWGLTWMTYASPPHTRVYCASQSAAMAYWYAYMHSVYNTHWHVTLHHSNCMAPSLCGTGNPVLRTVPRALRQWSDFARCGTTSVSESCHGEQSREVCTRYLEISSVCTDFASDLKQVTVIIWRGIHHPQCGVLKKEVWLY